MRGVIRIENLTKVYNGITAVDSLNLEVKKGEVFGFLGPNGAGKTTTIKAMMGLLEPTKGKITIHDEVVSVFSGISSSRVGYLPEVVDLWDNLTGRETLEFMCDLKEVPRKEVDEKLHKVGLRDAGERRVKGYSKGMLQRLALAQSVLGEPDLLVLDEPSAGLDPSGTALVKNIVREHVTKGGTVFFSSHILPSVEAVAHRVGILVDGKLRALDSLDNLREELQIPTRMQLVLSSHHDEIKDDLKQNSSIRSYKGNKNMITITCAKRDKKKVLDLVENSGTEIIDFDIQ